MDWRNLEFIERRLKQSRLAEVSSTVLKSETSDATDSFKTYEDVIKNIEFSVSDMPNKKTLQVFRYREDGFFAGFFESFTFEFDNDYELASGDEDMLEEFVSDIRMSSTKIQDYLQDLNSVLELFDEAFEQRNSDSGTIVYEVPKQYNDIIKIIVTTLNDSTTVVQVSAKSSFEDAILNKTFEFQNGKIQNRSQHDAEQFANLLEGLV